MAPISPITEETITIRPLRRSSICANAAWARKNAPDRFTAMTLFHSSSVIFATVLSIVMPALLIRIQAAVAVDDLADSSPTVVRAPDIALMDADLGAATGRRQLGEELLSLLSIPAVPRGYRCTLTCQALADRRADAPGTTGHERNTPTELISPSLQRPGLANRINIHRSRHSDAPPCRSSSRGHYCRQASAQTAD